MLNPKTFKTMITSPTLLVDEHKCRANIRRIVRKAEKHHLEFRPHFKTHQSADIGSWFKDEGVSGITVSSVKMALYFARNGWKDITIAFPVNIREMEAINKLSEEISVTILISTPDIIEKLADKAESAIGVMIEIDTGSNRTGLEVNHIEEIQKLIAGLSECKNLEFKGFYSHPGHSYAARSAEEIKETHKNVLSKISDLVSGLSLDRKEYSICIGDTPCSSVSTNFEGIDQISPGNLVFYDLMQVQIGSCSIREIAVALACPVVAKYPSRKEIVVHGGAVHLSKEAMEENGTKHFGFPAHLNEDGWQVSDDNGYVKSLSQEHGIIKCSSAFMKTVSPGGLIAILPVHSCLCADLMGGYQSLGGETLNHLRTAGL